MSQLTFSPNQNQSRTRNQWLSDGWSNNKPLMVTGIVSILMLAVTAIGIFIDGRTLLGESIWIKPTKFAISSAFYSLTLLWLLTFIKNRPRLVATVSWVTAIAMTGELAIIAYQANRGVRSHFNVATPFDATLFGIMGTMIMALWIVSLIAAIYLIRQSFTHKVWGAALKWGLVISVIGSGLGYLMTMPTASQLTSAEETGIMLEAGAHSVGVPDGGEGLPFVGWSTEGGDLRIGHFLGLHGMQVLPLLGYFIIQQNRRLSGRKQRQLITIASLGYLGVIAVVTIQALRGESIIAPGTATLISWAIVTLGTIIASWLVIVRAGNEVARA